MSRKGVRESRGKTKQGGPDGPSSTNGQSRSEHPIFDALIMEAMLTPRDQMLTTEQVARELGITEEERAAAREVIATWEPDGPEENEAVVIPDGRSKTRRSSPRSQ